MKKASQNVKQRQAQQANIKTCSRGHRYTIGGICLVCYPGRIDKEKLQPTPAMTEEEKAVFRQRGFNAD